MEVTKEHFEIEEIMPDAEIVHDAANRLTFVEFCVWYGDLIKRINKVISRKTQKEAEERKTAEVAYKEYFGTEYIADNTTINRSVIRFAEEYASQFASQSLPEISDEKIVCEAIDQYGETLIVPEKAFEAGARWAINELKQRMK